MFHHAFRNPQYVKIRHVVSKRQEQENIVRCDTILQWHTIRSFLCFTVPEFNSTG